MKPILVTPFIGLSAAAIFAAAMLTTASCSAQDAPEKRVEQRLVEYIANLEQKERAAAGPNLNCERERTNSKIAAAKYALSTLRTEFKLPKP